MNADEEAAALDRLAKLLESGYVPKGRKPPKSITGLAQAVRLHYPQIQQYRDEGRSWLDVADILKKAAIPLNGSEWEATKLRVAMSKERRRRLPTPGPKKPPLSPFDASLMLLTMAAQGIDGDDGQLQAALIALAERCDDLDWELIRKDGR